MIKYRLICDKGHEFDAWFKCSATFEDQRNCGHLTCAVCRSRKIDRAVMAPALALRSGDSGDLMTEEDRKKRDIIEKLVDHVERDFDYVGEILPTKREKFIMARRASARFMAKPHSGKRKIC